VVQTSFLNDSQTWQDISEGLPKNLQDGSESVGFLQMKVGSIKVLEMRYSTVNQFP
jgi:hypothetical protein